MWAEATLTIDRGDVLFAYVYLDPNSMPTEIMLQWQTSDGSWEHRAYWGESNHFDWGVDGTGSRRPMGGLPPAGGWVRLEVPAGLVDLEGMTLTGMGFTAWDGPALWGPAGRSSRVDGAEAVDAVLVGDALPAGAQADGVNEGWNWIGVDRAPFSGPGRTLLGTSITDGQGAFRIDIEESLFRETFTNRRPEIFFKVFRGDQLIGGVEQSIERDTSGGETHLIIVDIASVEIDLVIQPGLEPQPSEYAQLLAELTPLLNGLQLANLTDEDITSLARKTESNPNRIEVLARATQLSRETDLPAEVFYGLARQNLSLKLKRILREDPGLLRESLERAIKRNIVPASVAESFAKIMRRFDQLRSDRRPLDELINSLHLEVPADWACKPAKADQADDVRAAKFDLLRTRVPHSIQ